MSTRILLVDDHALFRRGLRHLIEEEPGLDVVGVADDAAAAIELASESKPDIVVMGVSMPGRDGIQATRQILADAPEIGVITLSDDTGQGFVGEMLRAGARGYVLKKSDPEDLVTALRTVAGGGVYLSPEIAGAVVSELVASPPGGEVPQTGDDPSQLVLRTKLHGPPATPDLIHRAALMERWDEMRTRPLTVISAPAGYGKSTLASQWVAAFDGPCAWLSLDEDDDDPRVFLSALVASVRMAFPESCRETARLLHAAQFPAASVLSRTFLNDLAGIAQSFVLVLDDYHHIRSEAVHNILTELLNHPPQRVHTILLTRRDPPLPISTLRGRGQVNEFGAAETRFSVEETAAFLETLVDASLGDETARTIQQKLEGWPAGMRLMAQSFRNDSNLERLLAGLQGGFASVVDYLMDEVLSRLPPLIAERMIESSIISRFCAPLCDALHGQADTADETGLDCHEFIDRLGRDNLFLIGLDTEGFWFRFHHLFQDLLRMQLTRRRSAEEIAALHSRASRWFAGNGHMEEAIRHAVAADDLDGAAALVEKHRHTALEEDRWFVLERWISAFPEEAIRQRPVLLLTQIWLHDYRFEHEELATALDAADDLVAEDDPLRAEVEFFRGYQCYFENDPVRSLAHLRAARDRTPDEHHEFLVQSEMVIGMARQMVGEAEPALKQLKDLLLARRGLRGGTKTRLQASIVFVHLLEGRLPRAEAAIRELHRTARQGGYRHAEAWAVYLQGILHFQRTEWSKAIDCFGLVARDRYIIEKRAVLDSLLGQALAHDRGGRSDLADRALEEMVEFADPVRDPYGSQIAESGRARLSLLRDGASATRLLQGPPPPDENMGWWLEIPAVTWCRALLAEGSDESVRTARERLAELLRLNERNHNVLQSVDILCLLAVAEGGAAHARRAADLAVPGGIRRPFVEAGPRLIDLLRLALDEDPDAESVRQILEFLGAEGPADTGPLTAREAEVLRLVGEGLSNKEIAARIFRSMETVKKHLYNTYQKLEVDSRIAALAKAREMGILP